MAGGVTLSVRQIGSYPALPSVAAPAGGLILLQEGGLGGPYATVTPQVLVSTALQNGGGPLGVGMVPPGNAASPEVFLGSLNFQAEAQILWDAYGLNTGGEASISGGVPGSFGFSSPVGWNWAIAPPAPAQSGNLAWFNLMTLTPNGALNLPLGTLTVARDPGAALEVATMGWVGRNTATSFNGRRGAVTLNGCDIYSALCLDSLLATENWVSAQIQSSIQMLLANHPFVFGWNGRTGAVWLTLADISCVFFQPGQQPITQTPPLTSNDYSIPNTAWVVEYIANEFAGGGGNLATQSWVLANTVNSFNGRKGVVTLTSSDVFDVGAAPLNSPNFSGVPSAPTAAVGQATGQIATTAFVQMAISANTAGVSTFNTRSGAVVLEAADVEAVGGLVNPSPGLTGNPTAPTQPPGTNLPVIATCEFVQAALASGAVTSFNTRTGAVTLALADVTGVGGAPIVSPAFSSVPTAPTAAPGTNTVQLATCAFVNAALTAAGGVSSFNSRTGAVTLTANDVSAVGALVNPSVGLTGSPTATTATAGDNSTRIATTAFVTTALSSGAVTSFNTRTGAVTLQGADITAAGGALLAGPAFTGVPTAPTAPAATNNTQIATTAYVTAAILADTTGVTSFNTRTGAITLLLADITGSGGAPLASPSFTGVPLGPTATAGTSTTQLATTAFVQNAIASSGVSSFNSRTGAVTLIANDLSAAGGALLASPIFTGTPACPTAAPGTNTTQLATTAFVAAALGSYLPLSGGILTGPLTLPNGTSTAPALNIGNGGGFYAAQSGQINLGGTGTVLSAPNVTASSGLSTNGNLTVQSNASISGLLTVNQVSVTGTGGAAIGVSGGITVTGVVTTGAINATNASNFSTLVTGQITPNANDAIWCGLPVGSGNAWYGVAAYSFPQQSDLSLKRDVTRLDAALGVVGKIFPISFFWKEGPDQEHPHLGFIAGEVNDVLGHGTAPGAAAAEGGPVYSINTNELVAVLWRAVQQLVARVGALEAAAGITPPAGEVA